MPETMKEVVVLLGPTAAGKTAVSIPLARALDAEIISADSRQVYTGLDIGTAKPSRTERGGIPHHLIDIVPPNADFTVADFQKLAFEKLEEIHSRGKNALVVGGTGLYIRALVDRPAYQSQPPVPHLRREILEDIADRGSAAVHDELARFDPDAAAGIHPNNIPRLVRAMEVVRATGRRFSDAVRADRARSGEESLYNWHIVGLNMDRELLYDRINRRVLKMVDDGWVNEVRDLLDGGCSGEEKPLQGLGYRDIVSVVRGEKKLEDVVDIVQRDTRRFAKRQLTYFRKLEGIRWLVLEDGFDPEAEAARILERARQSRTC